MNSDHTYFSFKEFTLFLYVHIAYSNDHLDQNEENLILSKMKNIFPKEENIKVKYEQFKNDYKSLKSDEVDKLIILNFKKFSDISFSHKYHVYCEMYDIINADGVIDELEIEAMNRLKRIIDSSVHSK